MAATLARYPRVHATFNLTPILLDQLDGIASGGTDPYTTVARTPAETLSGPDRQFLLAHFFDLHHERMLDPYPRYRDLFERARQLPAQTGQGSDATPALSVQDLRDLQVWFHLAWIDPSHRHDEPVRSLFEKGRGFTEEEKIALLKWGAECAGSIEGVYRALEAGGQIEISTSAYHHPILPLLIDSDSPRESSASIPLPNPAYRAPADAETQIRRAREAHARRFGHPPRGTWPPEGAVSQATLAQLAAAGFRWVASDEAVLAAAMAGKGTDHPAWPGPLYTAHRVETTSGPIAMVFRDRMLSDLIGFTYSRWDPRDAAEDFVRRVREVRRALPDDESPLVTVILDGENCWEFYAEDGNPFLAELYRLLEADPEIEPVTVSEALDRVPPVSRLHHVPVGSWIRADLGIWVGHPEKNRAWAELGRAREAVLKAAGAGVAGAAAALEQIYAAEASDWFWWYGDDHPSTHRETFDRLFRSRLIAAYREIGIATPASLLQSLRSGQPGPVGEAGAVTDEPGAIAYVRPALDGRETDLGEWREAIVHDLAGSTGSMHRVSGIMRTVRFGTDGSELYIRVDLEVPNEMPSDLSVGIEFSGIEKPLARVALGSGRQGVPTWSGPDRGGAAVDPGEYALDEILEIRLPLEACGRGRVRSLQFRVLLEQRGQPAETAPHGGWFELLVPPEDPRASLRSTV